MSLVDCEFFGDLRTELNVDDIHIKSENYVCQSEKLDHILGCAVQLVKAELCICMTHSRISLFSLASHDSYRDLELLAQLTSEYKRKCS